MTDRERWEEIRDDVSLAVFRPDKSVRQAWLLGFNEACKRLAAQERELAEARELIARLDARITRLVDALNDQWSRWNTMSSVRTRNDGREVVRAAMRAASEALSTAEDPTHD